MELEISTDEVNTTLVITEKLGATVVSEAIIENPDGSPYKIEIDFQGQKKNE